MENTIHTTTNYSIFKKLVGNRNVSESRKRELKKSIATVGWVTNPIIVNEKMEVVDGQGRLAVLEELGMPVQYIVKTGAGLSECQEMNLHTANWKTSDFIMSEADTGNESCRKLVQIMNDYDISYRLAIVPFANSHGVGGARNIYKRLSISEPEYLDARTFFDFYKLVHDDVRKLYGRNDVICRALYYIYKHGANMEELGKAIKRIDRDIFNGSNVGLAIKGFQDAYNYNRKLRKNRLYAYESYRKGE